MNLKQKVATGVAMVLFALTLVCAPWRVNAANQGYVFGASWNATGPIWKAPRNARLQLPVLLIEWFGIGVCYVAVYFICKDAVAAPPPKVKPRSESPTVHLS
jgi:hypothetical protein